MRIFSKFKPRIHWPLAALLILALAGCSKKAAVDVNLTSPKDAFNTYLHAMMAGDAATARQAVTGNDEMMKKIEAASQVMPAIRRVADAMKAKFSSKETSQFSAEDFDKAMLGNTVAGETQKIDGETATLTKTGSPTLKFKKTGNDWKLDAAAAGGPLLSGSIDAIQSVVKELNQAADQINSGEIKTLPEAEAKVDAITAKLH